MGVAFRRLSCLLMIVSSFVLISTVTLATEADDLCTGDPCVVDGTKPVEDGSDLDFGDRKLVVNGALGLEQDAQVSILAREMETATQSVISGLGDTLLEIEVVIATLNGRISVFDFELFCELCQFGAGPFLFVGSLDTGGGSFRLDQFSQPGSISRSPGFTPGVVFDATNVDLSPDGLFDVTATDSVSGDANVTTPNGEAAICGEGEVSTALGLNADDVSVESFSHVNLGFVGNVDFMQVFGDDVKINFGNAATLVAGRQLSGEAFVKFLDATADRVLNASGTVRTVETVLDAGGQVQANNLTAIGSGNQDGIKQLVLKGQVAPESAFFASGCTISAVNSQVSAGVVGLAAAAIAGAPSYTFNDFVVDSPLTSIGSDPGNPPDLTGATFSSPPVLLDLDGRDCDPGEVATPTSAPTGATQTPTPTATSVATDGPATPTGSPVTPAQTPTGTPPVPTSSPIAATATPTDGATALPTETPASSPCVGDCDAGGGAGAGGVPEVMIGELITMVNVALGNTDVTACPAGDPNGDGEISIAELITAVNNALNGCPV